MDQVSGSDVALEDRGLGQPGQPLADASGPRLADPVDGLQVVDARCEQLLQAAEVLDQPVHDETRETRHPRQQPVATGADGGVETLAAVVAEGEGVSRGVSTEVVLLAATARSRALTMIDGLGLP